MNVIFFTAWHSRRDKEGSRFHSLPLWRMISSYLCVDLTRAQELSQVESTGNETSLCPTRTGRNPGSQISRHANWRRRTLMLTCLLGMQVSSVSAGYFKALPFFQLAKIFLIKALISQLALTWLITTKEWQALKIKAWLFLNTRIREEFQSLYSS